MKLPKPTNAKKSVQKLAEVAMEGKQVAVSAIEDGGVLGALATLARRKRPKNPIELPPVGQGNDGVNKWSTDQYKVEKLFRKYHTELGSVSISTNGMRFTVNGRNNACHIFKKT